VSVDPIAACRNDAALRARIEARTARVGVVAANTRDRANAGNALESVGLANPVAPGNAVA
jgi:hypothetical protein